MKIRLLILFYIICFTSRAQISVDNSDMPTLNDTLRFSTASASVLSLINQQGANQSWDATSLTPTFQNLASYKSPVSINPLYLLAFSGSTYGTASSDFNIGAIIQADETYSFYRNASGYYIQTGRAFSVQGIPLTQTWRDTIYRFTPVFGQKDSNTWVSNQVDAIVASIRSTGKRVNEVDSWGTITTPYGTFDCIRIKSVIRTTDSIRTTLLPFTIPFTQTVTEYKWIAKGQGIPILEIVQTSGIGGQTTIRYRDIYRPEAFEGLANFSANKYTFQTGSLTDTCFLFDDSPRNPQSRVWTITPNTFRFVGGTNANSVEPKLLFEAAGAYSIRLQVNYAAGSSIVEQNDIILVGNGPKAGFTTSHTFCNTSTIVQLTDTSIGNPFAWEWSISPPTVSYVGGTTQFSQNPKLVFDFNGVYSISLKCVNEIGEDRIEQSNLITVFTTGLSEAEQSKFKLYPNPAHVNVNIYTYQQIQSVYAISIEGKRFDLSVDESGTVAISTLADGIYQMCAQVQNGDILTTRLVVLHH